MAFQVSIPTSGHSFLAEAEETILEAALRQGLSLPYGCRDGACGACRGRILAGVIDHGRAPLDILGSVDRDAGLALFCCARARSDLAIESREARSFDDLPIRTLPARVARLVQAAPEVMIVDLKLPASERLRFLAGQYIDILLPGGKRRSFSLANAPHDDEFLQLHVRRVAGGQFTGHVFSALRERDLLRLRGPFGSFFLREESGKPLLFVAGGTGFAPIKSIVEHAIAQGCRRRMDIYWGGRRSVDLYFRPLAERWSTEFPQIRFVPVLSEPTADELLSYRSGFVHVAAMADLPDLSGHQVYVCGSPAMVAAARRDFVSNCSLPPDEFFADAFDFASDTLAAIEAADRPETRPKEND
ncbi:CDP-6-deoxy-delta-3,4-glucoseen reductase [Accumulibacter sp.]|uniref:CDP-6-deoxy-delta-3,4-glucoseen reductase n=1 Tax=Accumulibacter sp. TaxID=2053492 RepID=UPI0025EBBCA3|nr:CDP-6-deoxy-delta-3,4-glucoseen reductase [Accumulibacter sp.]MCM8594412.1 CDP-6-deoxy-delta-3,4-glucoseen reductase [Accumulibacter sp.]MDS4048557.1 CDP-6-deoxy-delta-3,4-glucoseen reductase [Accumulibacter sp.]